MLSAHSSSIRKTHLPLRPAFLMAVLLLVALALAASAPMTSTAQAAPLLRTFNPSDILLPDGYQIEVVATGLNAPTTALFDRNDVIVAESGWGGTTPPRILRIKPDGTVIGIASVGLQPPVMGLALWRGQLFVSHRGKISVVQPDGRLRDILTGLPSDGDNPNNNIAIGPDNRIYVAQGTVTNAGVVGVDNFRLGWLDKNPGLHEIPCQDVTLLGQNYQTPNPLNADEPFALTGAYEPFGTPSTPDQSVKGDLKCGGSILRLNPDGGALQVMAWGLRDPVGLKFDAQGRLWTTNRGTDLRGSRIISGDPDSLVQVVPDAWYGWPDYFDGRPVTDDRFKAPGKPEPGFLWDDHPPLSQSYLSFQPFAGAGGLAFSPGDRFGFRGSAFVAMFGAFPALIREGEPFAVGARIVRVEVNSKQVSDFATNRVPGPSDGNLSSGLDRPSDVAFAPDQSLYIVDWGAMSSSGTNGQPAPQSGAIWRVYPKGQRAVRPNGPVIIPPSSKILGSGRPAAAPTLGGTDMDIIRIVSLIVGSFVIALGTMILARRYWIR